MLNNALRQTKGARLLAILAGAASLASVMALPAAAVPVAPGGGVGLRGTTVAARPELAGTVLKDEIREFSFVTASGGLVKGTFQDRLVKRTSTGTLDFVFRIKNSPESKGDIVFVQRTNYGAFPTLDVDFRLDGLGTVGAPAAAFPGGPTGVAHFDFYNAPIRPGQESRFHFIGVRGVNYEVAGVATLRSNDGASTSFKVFAPVVGGGGKVKEEKLPDLVARLSGPRTAKPGENISNRIKVIARNIGNTGAPGTVGTLNPSGGYMLDVFLSRDRSAPEGYANYSPNFSEDVLLLGGRISNTTDLAVNAEKSYATGATIPADTPPGRYFLGVRVDSGNKVNELSEKNNTFFAPIEIR